MAARGPLRSLELGGTWKNLSHKYKTLLYSEDGVTVYRDENSHPENHRVMPTHTHFHTSCRHTAATRWFHAKTEGLGLFDV